VVILWILSLANVQPKSGEKYRGARKEEDERVAIQDLEILEQIYSSILNRYFQN